MTAPEFRRQGILLHLGEEANRHWRASGYAVVVGLPNEQWGSRTRMLGWQTLFPLEWLRFPLHLGRVASRPGKVPRLPSRPGLSRRRGRCPPAGAPARWEPGTSNRAKRRRSDRGRRNSTGSGPPGRSLCQLRGERCLLRTVALSGRSSRPLQSPPGEEGASRWGTSPTGPGHRAAGTTPT